MDPIQRFVNEIGRYFSAEAGYPAPHARNVLFPGDVARTVIRVPRSADPAVVISALQITPVGPALAVTGGASLMDDASIAAARAMLEDGLSSFAQAHQAVIVDGGTAVGTMAMLGEARQRHGCTFPLIGVVPGSRVAVPGEGSAADQTELDPNHSHFVLVDAPDWGDESDMLAGLAAAAGRSSGDHPSVLGVIINGGAIVAKEAYARATGDLRLPLLVLEGSGRFADTLASAYHTRQTDDPQIRAILDQGEIYVHPIHGDPAALRQWLESFFGL